MLNKNAFGFKTDKAKALKATKSIVAENILPASLCADKPFFAIIATIPQIKAQKPEPMCTERKILYAISRLFKLIIIQQ